MSNAFDVFTRAAHDSVKLADGWAGVIFTKVGHGANSQGTMVLGAVCPPKVRGPDKGEPSWARRDRATEREVFVSDEAFYKARDAMLAEDISAFSCSDFPAQQGRAEA